MSAVLHFNELKFIYINLLKPYSFSHNLFIACPHEVKTEILQWVLFQARNLFTGTYIILKLEITHEMTVSCLILSNYIHAESISYFSLYNGKLPLPIQKLGLKRTPFVDWMCAFA